MHPRIQAQRESEAAESIDSAVSALAKRYGVEVEDSSVPVRDPALKALFKAEYDAEQLKEIVKMSRSSDAREREALKRIEATLAAAGVELETPIRSTDVDAGMRAAWSLSVIADILPGLLGVEVESEEKSEVEAPNAELSTTVVEVPQVVEAKPTKGK